MMTDEEQEFAPFNKIQGVSSTNVVAYSNEYDDFISFEGSYVLGIFTGFKWQCVEFARRWLLLCKGCIFQSIGTAADMWHKLSFVERVTDGQKFHLKKYPNGSPYKPTCDTFLIYSASIQAPYGHIAVIYGLYYIEDDLNIYGWMEIENNDQLRSLNESNINLILEKYRQPKEISGLNRCIAPHKVFDDMSVLYSMDINYQNEKCSMKFNANDRCYYQANDDFFIHISSISNELYALFMQVTDSIIHDDEILRDLEIPNQFWLRIRKSWIDERKFDVMDHMEFKLDEKNLKLCKYKVNRALMIFLSAVLQEKSIQTMNVVHDFTSTFQLHHLLVRYWKKLDIKNTIHILIDSEDELKESIIYMQKVMIEAGINVKICLLPNELHWKNSTIVDSDGEIVKIVWKVWIWEKIFQDFTDQYDVNKEKNCWTPAHKEHPCLSDISLNEQIRIIEPLWKSITNLTAFLSILSRKFPNHPSIVSNEWISSKDSKYIPLVNWSTEKKNNDIIQSYNTTKIFDYRHMSQEIIPEKNCENSDKTIVSLMIHGFCAGFSIIEDPNHVMDAKNNKVYCCII
ncbi:unnamed protein product [Rotaria magnacalcarata]|uniref:Glutathionylspermidine synthase pre-ATP-grasp-like domain-containing protein n=3 Tax=Rotaria magnacalcarata TaxID=392030 RepID=A0A8S2NQC6_9BILA|nr:unnamed protein product [Rotaria magnacalcarata]